MGQITSEPLSLHAVSCTAQLPPKTRQNENGGGCIRINFARQLSFDFLDAFVFGFCN